MLQCPLFSFALLSTSVRAERYWRCARPAAPQPPLTRTARVPSVSTEDAPQPPSRACCLSRFYQGEAGDAGGPQVPADGGMSPLTPSRVTGKTDRGRGRGSLSVESARTTTREEGAGPARRSLCFGRARGHSHNTGRSLSYFLSVHLPGQAWGGVELSVLQTPGRTVTAGSTEHSRENTCAAGGKSLVFSLSPNPDSLLP